MNSITQQRNIKESATACDHRYNWQHIVVKTKYRYKMFKNPKTCKIIHDAMYDSARRHGIGIKEFAIGEDHAHIHLEIDVPVAMSVAYAVQLLKGYSSYMVFKEMPNHRLRYWKGHFWAEKFSNGSVGPQNEETIQNYIRRQDIYGQITLAF
jgi:REP element-mobilizing transposase RayT